jgi:rhodanese-related sulfurtransferase
LFQENILVIDVREKYELPVLEGVQYLSIPASEWETRKTEFISDKTVVVVCQSGIRSLKIVNQIKKIHTNRAIYSLHGGVNHWVKNKAI